MSVLFSTVRVPLVFSLIPVKPVTCTASVAAGADRVGPSETMLPKKSRRGNKLPVQISRLEILS